MAGDPATVELSRADLRAVAAFAAACARAALEVSEAARPEDSRPRAAVDAAQAFADGADRSRGLRDAAWAAQRAAHDARDAGELAAAEAARAAMAAAGAAYLHPLPRATQVRHVLGAGAHAARAFELAAGGDDAVADAHLVRARRLATSTVVEVLGRYPGPPAGGGRVGALTRALDALLRRHDSVDEPRLLDADAVTWALQGLVGVRVWSVQVVGPGALALDLGGRAIGADGGVRGEFHLVVPGGAWLARQAGVVLATSDDAREVREAAAATLAGRPVTAIALSVDGRALRIDLAGSGTLMVVPSALDLAAERWRLVLPDGPSIVAGPGPLLRLTGESGAEARTPEPRQ